MRAIRDILLVLVGIAIFLRCTLAEVLSPPLLMLSAAMVMTPLWLRMDEHAMERELEQHEVKKAPSNNALSWARSIHAGETWEEPETHPESPEAMMELGELQRQRDRDIAIARMEKELGIGQP